MFKYKHLILFSLLVLLSCQPKEAELSIVVTTDVHGAFFHQDPISGKTWNGSMAHVHSFVKELRTNHEVILLDNGDIIQGDPGIYFYNFEKTNTTHLLSEAFAFMKYDAATVGNHDIETGHEVYDRIQEELTIPWLAANCINSETNEPYFKPYSIIKRQGIKIAVLGLITPRIPDWLPNNIWSGMHFADMIETAKHWVPKIQKEENPDLLIGLFHAGLDYTYNNQDASTPQNENAVRLIARQVPGFDILFAGHDHQTWNEYQVDPDGDSVLLMGSQSKAREVALAKISLIKNKGSWSINSLLGETVSMSNYEPDTEYISHFASHFKEVSAYVKQEVAELKTPLATSEAFFGPSAFMTLIHQVQLDLSGAELSFAAPLSFSRTIPAGTLYVDDLFDLYRYENLLYTMELSGQEILDYLNYSYTFWLNTMRNADDHLIKLVPGKDGTLKTAKAYYNFDSAAGLDYTVDVSKEAGNMVHISQLSSGEPFSLEKKYKVAINSYRGNGGGDLLTLGAGIPEDELDQRILNATDKDLRYYMKGWMEDRGIIEIQTQENWKIVPENWAQKGKEKSYKVLFKN